MATALSKEATLRFIAACVIGISILATTGFAVAGQRENLSHPGRHSDGCWDLLQVAAALREHDRKLVVNRTSSERAIAALREHDRKLVVNRTSSERAICDVDGDGRCDPDDKALIAKILSGAVDFQRKCLVP